MSALLYTRRLVEHRYGCRLEDLRQDAVRTGTSDPVLPIVLRRLDDLAETAAETCAARRHLDAAWQRRRPGDHCFDDLLLRQTTEVRDGERREEAAAMAVWDLLDIRLLLDGPGARPAATRRTGPCDDEELLATARQVAAGLPRLSRETLRRGLRTLGIHVSNHRLGLVLQRLRAERAPH